jgi:uncharacterized membrane protein (UPF0127 family)
MKRRQVLHVESGQILIPAARWCDTFGQKLRGFTFHAPIGEDEGLVLVETADSRLNSGIHMLFVSFDLGVLWVNSQGRVVDTVVAKPWRLSYMPQEPAQYIVEGHPNRLKHVRVGDTIQFLEAAAK